MCYNQDINGIFYDIDIRVWYLGLCLNSYNSVLKIAYILFAVIGIFFVDIE